MTYLNECNAYAPLVNGRDDILALAGRLLEIRKQYKHEQVTVLRINRVHNISWQIVYTHGIKERDEK